MNNKDDSADDDGVDDTIKTNRKREKKTLKLKN